MKRIPLGKVTIDPRRTNIFMDSCSFDPKYAPEDIASQRLFHLYDAGQINIIIAHSNMKELAHPNVPAYVKNEANAKIFSIGVQLTTEELALKERILDLLAGNGRREQMQQDAEHVFEAQKYGKLFVTTDKRILRKKTKLCQLCGVVLLLPSGLLDLIESYGQ